MIKWTKEKCMEIALNYENKIDYLNNSPLSYNSAYLHGWLNEICYHMESSKRKHYWTFDECKEEALKYSNKKDFRKKSMSHYTKCLSEKWLDDLCCHMINRKLSNYWTFERCKEEALKYTMKKDFIKKSNSAYCKSWKEKWLDKICSHMDISGNKYKRCIYAYEFIETNCVYVGLTFNTNERNKQHEKRGPVFNHLKRNNIIPIFKKLTEYIDADEAKIKEGEFVERYKNDGWNMLNSVKTGSLGGGCRKWTKEKCMEDAKNYKTKPEYRLSLSYRSALRNKWLDEIYVYCGFNPTIKRIKKSDIQKV